MYSKSCFYVLLNNSINNIFFFTKNGKNVLLFKSLIIVYNEGKQVSD